MKELTGMSWHWIPEVESHGFLGKGYAATNWSGVAEWMALFCGTVESSSTFHFGIALAGNVLKQLVVECDFIWKVMCPLWSILMLWNLCVVVNM